MGLLHSIKFALPLGFSTALFSSGGAQLVEYPPAEVVSIPVVQPVTGPDSAEQAEFAGYLQLVAARARGEGVRQGTIDSMLAGLIYNPRVIALDRSQPGARPNSPPAFWPYYRKHISQARIDAGRTMLRDSAALLPGIEAEYGVPAKVLLAIWGKESFYGRVKGDFDLPRALATLAYEGRRRELFEGELIALMKMADRGVPRARMLGSWAGAFGNPQFLPSVYLRLARDGDGDGLADIWYSRADTLTSIANYFRDAGWRPNEPWGVRALVPFSGFDRSLLGPDLEAPSCPRVHTRHSVWKTVSEWRALGVSPLAPIDETTMATLFEPDGPGNGAFLLTGNYRVILHYNCSNYYALSVGLLADEIAR
jgi:lytic murein transglycosylase